MNIEWFFTAFLSLTFGYLLGATPTSVWLAKAMKLPDPRLFGSGNPGATNMLRSGGSKAKKAAILTLLGDILKGAIAVALVAWLGGEPALAMLGAVVGHCFSFWLKFKGGKGVATGVGVLIAYSPILAGAVLLVFIGVLLVSRMVSLSSTLAAFFAPLILLFAQPLGLGKNAAWLDVACLTIVSAIIIIRHRENLKRVWAGTESTLMASKNKTSGDAE